MIKRHALSFEERLGVLDFLKTVCKKDGEYAVYERGYNDVAVAKILGVKESNVQSIRLSQFGKTKEARILHVEDKKNDDSIVDRLSDLESRIAYLEKELGVTLK